MTDDRQPTPPPGHARTTIAILRQAKRDGELPPDEADAAIERHRAAEREHDPADGDREGEA